MPSKQPFYESEKISKLSSPFKPAATGASMMFPELNWNLKKAGMNIDPIIYVSTAIFLALMVFTGGVLVFLPAIVNGSIDFALIIAIAGIFSLMSFFYMIFLPSLKIVKSQKEIDKNLEYMLKDMEIQLTAGIPLFDIFVNISAGEYGGCSKVSRKIVEEVQSGKSIITVLDDTGMLSPSEYMRRVLWQIVNALKTGSNVGVSLKMISKEIRDEKENAIASYTQELGLWSLIYMIFVIILPSMGVTLILILSSFLGTGVVTEMVFWLILGVVIVFQLIFVSIIKSKRPDV